MLAPGVPLVPTVLMVPMELPALPVLRVPLVHKAQLVLPVRREHKDRRVSRETLATRDLSELRVRRVFKGLLVLRV
jgi:hypothetical protein